MHQSLVSHPAPDVFRNAFDEVSYMSSTQGRVKLNISDSRQRDFTDEIKNVALRVIKELNFKHLPTEDDVKREAMYGERATEKGSSESAKNQGLDEIYSFRAEFGGFVFSFVDSAPTEIAVASIRNLNALARWNKVRSTDASFIFSIGWLQIDNHIPSAPFKVAFRPDKDTSVDDTKQVTEAEEHTSPLLVVALAFAPRHKSGIMVSPVYALFMYQKVPRPEQSFLVVFEICYCCTQKSCNSFRPCLSCSAPEILCWHQRAFSTTPL